MIICRQADYLNYGWTALQSEFLQNGDLKPRQHILRQMINRCINANVGNC